MTLSYEERAVFMNKSYLDIPTADYAVDRASSEVQMFTVFSFLAWGNEKQKIARPWR